MNIPPFGEILYPLKYDKNPPYLAGFYLSAH